MDNQDRQKIEIGSIRNAVARFRLDSVTAKMPRLNRVASSVSRWFIADAKWEPPRDDRKEWRRKKPDGTYEYSPTKPEEMGGPAQKPQEPSQKSKKPQEPDKDKKPTPQSHPQNFKHHVTLSKNQLAKTLSKGHFSIISAGRNPNDAKEAKMKPDDGFFHKRHEELRDELEKKGLKYTEVVGHYGGKETSFMVFHDSTELTPKTVKSIMVHHKDAGELKKNRKMLDEIGAKYKQDSVLYGSGGKFNLSFTTGKNKGKICGGKGWKETPEAEDFYTDIELKDKKHTKFSLDIGGCFKMGLL